MLPQVLRVHKLGVKLCTPLLHKTTYTTQMRLPLSEKTNLCPLRHKEHGILCELSPISSRILVRLTKNGQLTGKLCISIWHRQDCTELLNLKVALGTALNRQQQ